MVSTRVTSKGQATIPLPIRRLLGIRCHDRIRFHVENGRVWLEGDRESPKSLFGKYHREGMRKVSVEQMMRDAKRRVSDAEH
jgi:bifunctional DNA-binding transcriptional regulator/antitoxin component of YhaV-PrlF toxin-antitoxin module